MYTSRLQLLGTNQMMQFSSFLSADPCQQLSTLCQTKLMKQSNSDQLNQRFEKLKKASISKFMCPAKHPATLMCASKLCSKASIFCHNLECQACDQHRVNGCQNVSLSFLFQEAKQRHSVAQKLFGMLKGQLTETFAKIKKECLTFEWVYGDLKVETKKLYQQILEQGKCSGNKTVLLDLVTRLRQFKANWKEKGISVIKSTQNKLESFGKKIHQMKNEITLQIFSLKQWKVDSVILPPKDPKWQFILQSLNFPKKLELLFRASQHSFKASQFHNNCDGIQNTFILVRNEYDKLLGGFTPVPWSSPPIYQRKVDPKKQGFLLQLNIKQIMKIKYRQYAITCHQDCGPMFGFNQAINGSNKTYEFDLKIGDNCNVSRNSFFSFPLDYEFDEYSIQKYKKENNKFLSDMTQKDFYTMQYEVFQVVWQE